jgi:protein involved in polysaccharide export with SLBB domain
VRTYDFFKAERNGDLSQNPFLRPGDTITFNRIDRVISLSGEVERPGTYQLLKEENLRDLIDVYGTGFTPLADPSRIEIVRYVNSVSVSGDKIALGVEEYSNNYQLEHYDRVTVPTITKLQPILFVEGAVERIPMNASETVAIPTASTRLIVPFNRGEYYSSLVRRNSAWFTAVSDTRNAYIIRDDEQIPMNLNPMLYDAEYRGEVLVEENDTLVIPFRQYFVTVAGSVASPGRYPYIPDRQWDYYIALAGGFTPERNSRESITIVDIAGKHLKKTDTITPETVITARTNQWLYFFNQYAPVITTVLTLITTAITVTTLINR